MNSFRRRQKRLKDQIISKLDKILKLRITRTDKYQYASRYSFYCWYQSQIWCWNLLEAYLK